jgi:tRNA U38,U39,U40 pseudouridine synthase TruA
MIVFEIASKAFLYHMVRRLVAIQVSIGQRMLDLQELKNYFSLAYGKSSGNQPLYNKIAPPQGLFLSEVSYTHELAT